MNRRNCDIKGLYAITPDCSNTVDLIHRCESALLGGCNVLQYRNKQADTAKRLLQAQSLRNLTRRFSVPLIINDDVELAAAVDADGVHLGRHDDSIKRAHTLLGGHKTVGVSCYNQVPRAFEAQQAGADYVAFGAFFPSQIKPEAVKADIELLRRARGELDIPIVAIGGITADNAQPLISAGADAVAVISALFDAGDIMAAARNFVYLFESSKT